MQQKIQGAQVGQFEALHRTLYEIAEMALHPVGRDFARQHRIVCLAKSDDADIARVALIAGPCVR